MNLALVDQIAKAVLYEGYMLYPYRPSSVKNRQRFNFGVLYPKAYSDAQGGIDPVSLRTECLVRSDGDDGASLEIRLRFLQLQTRSSSARSENGAAENGWQQAMEREVTVVAMTLHKLCRQDVNQSFEFSAEHESAGAPTNVQCSQETVRGTIALHAARLHEDLFKVSVSVLNTTEMDASTATRDDALMLSLVSAHVVLGVEHGEFISLLEPPDEFKFATVTCENLGVWPVLVGESGQRDTLLASPIILYDYPQIAPESAGDLFDGTEIDEILSLRIMTLTDQEKEEVRRSDDRARDILERTEAMPAEQFLKLHGTVRGLRPLKEEAS